MLDSGLPSSFGYAGKKKTGLSLKRKWAAWEDYVRKWIPCGQGRRLLFFAVARNDSNAAESGGVWLSIARHRLRFDDMDTAEQAFPRAAIGFRDGGQEREWAIARSRVADIPYCGRRSLPLEDCLLTKAGESTATVCNAAFHVCVPRRALALSCDQLHDQQERCHDYGHTG